VVLVLGNNKKLLIILLSLVAATAVSAAPTMSDCNKNFIIGAVSPASNAHLPYILEASQINEFSNSHLAAIGIEILKPPADFTDSQTTGLKNLPPVPAAFFMALTGFLCVSLVKDRRFWLAVLAGLLWAGQAGFLAIPQLALNISKKHIQRKSPVSAVYLHQFENSGRLRSDIEGTQYIGLLRHLAGIPAGTMSLPLPASLLSLRTPFLSLRAKRSNLNLLAALKHVVSARAKSNSGTTQFAITHFSSLLNPAFICPAARAEQYIYFSPAFIFQLRPRSPPNKI